MVSKEEWMSEHSHEIEREWQFIHDEYGDAAPFLSDLKEQRWRESEEKEKLNG